jgi:hypothetical protein
VTDDECTTTTAVALLRVAEGLTLGGRKVDFVRVVYRTVLTAIFGFAVEHRLDVNELGTAVVCAVLAVLTAAWAVHALRRLLQSNALLSELDEFRHELGNAA